MATDRPMPVVLVDWRALRKNSLRGFAKVELGALVMSELPVHNTEGRRWVGMAARPQLNEDGSRRMGANGKPLWQSLTEWKTREAGERFSASVIAAIEEKHPGATDPGE